MATEQQSTFLNYTQHTLPPAQLWVGNHDQLVHTVQTFAQKLFCQHGGCQTCTTCMQIRDKQHHAMMWLHPEKTYTIEQLNDLFTTITFRLQPNEMFLFIIQKADFLTIACANKLLKSIEEPPAGYHFILLTERSEQIVPTIMSRCITHTLSATEKSPTHPLFASFTTYAPTMAEFSKILDTCGITERDSITLLDNLLAYWIEHYKNNPNEHHRSTAIISTLKKAYTQLPMPGSAILFWRNLYLAIQR
jgi:DNA polymerase-3 subunit delta'